MEDNFIVENRNDELECPNFCEARCPKVDDRSLCWTSDRCQKVCPDKCANQRGCYRSAGVDKCCHEQCLGGCTGPNDTQCFVCKNVLYDGRCQAHCPDDQYLFLKRRCIQEKECRAINNNSMRTDAHRWKLLEVGDGTQYRSCEVTCPANYQPTKNDTHRCIKCQGSCPKECQGLVIDSVAAAQKLKGCTIIVGILEIQIRGGTQVEMALEKYLGEIEVVTSYIRVLQSTALSSLFFLKSLKVIAGEHLFRDSYALFLLDNHNLQDIWDSSTHPPLQILNGKVFFHLNRKLCLGKIDHFIENVVGLKEDITETDVSRLNNGDQVACNVTEISISIYKTMSTWVLINWTNFYTNDDREFLSWVVSYREAPFKNVTVFGARDACGTDVWKTNDVSPDSDRSTLKMVAFLHNLKPFTQYAVYVQTYTITSATRGAMSPIIYFTTESDIPTAPREIVILTLHQGELFLSWQAPLRPNGNVTHYYIRWQPMPIDVEMFDLRDYCNDPLHHDKTSDDETSEELEEEDSKKFNASLVPAGQCCACAKSEEEKRTDMDERQYQIEFQNFLQNTIYRHKPLLDGDIIRNRPGKRESGRQKRHDLYSQLSQPSASSLLDNSSSGVAIFMNNNTNNAANVSGGDIVDEQEDQVEVMMVLNEQEVILPNLSHYQEYSIEVIACHDYDDDREKLCSQRAITSHRTLPKMEADVIDIANVTFVNGTRKNGTFVFIGWAEPVRPNGLIVSYILEVKKPGVSDIRADSYCISHRRYRQYLGYYLVEDDPGLKLLRFQSISLAGKSNWTDYIEFYPNVIIPPAGQFSSTALSDRVK